MNDTQLSVSEKKINEEKKKKWIKKQLIVTKKLNFEMGDTTVASKKYLF